MKKYFQLAAAFAVALSASADTFKLNHKNQTAEHDASQYREVDMSDWRVKEGTALDFSADFSAEPAGNKGRLRVSKDAHFSFAAEPNTNVKFQGTNWRPGNYFKRGIANHEEIDAVAKSIRRQGYNLVRWRISMYRAREFDGAYKMKPDVRDFYDYFIFALAREGVYTHFHLSSHDLGDPTFKWNDRYDVKLKMILGDKKTWEDWRKLVKMELEHVNPYTGRAWKDDPSIITTEYFNELELGIVMRKQLSPEAAKFGDEKYAEWLKKHFADISELNRRWNTKFKSFDDIRAFSGAYGSLNKPELSKFFVEKSRATMEFCRKVLRDEIGCDIILHQYNCGVRPDIFRESAAEGDYMAFNTYSRNMGGVLDDNCDFWLKAISKRTCDMPMVMTEYQQMPNTRNVHETGVIFPALAALQDFSILTIHDCAVFADSADSYNTAAHPIYRANEFLSHCFFYRGDVEKSPHRVDVEFSDKFFFSDGAIWRVPSLEQAKISFLTGYAFDWTDVVKRRPDGAKTAPADIRLLPAKGVKNGSTTGPAFDLAAFAETLRAKKILPKDNITDISAGIFQSDTGQIELRPKEGTAKVITPKSEAVVVRPETRNVKLDRLEFASSSVAAAVALCSVDGKKISESGRLVLVYSTDALVNSVNLTKNEKTPVPALLKTGRLRAKISLDARKKYSVYALKINGERLSEIFVPQSDGVLALDIDTAKLPREPSVFFEIVEK